MSKDKPENLDQVRRDDRNLSIAGKRWEEPTGDDIAMELLKKIREDVEEED